MTTTKVSEKILNIEKDNQTITLTWKECLFILNEFIYSEKGKKNQIESEVL